MKTLVVYYSRTGTTRTVAQQIAAALGADLEEVHDRERRGGPIGWLRCGYQGYTGKLADIDDPVRDPSDYDLVVIGGPIWASSVSSPIRTFLRRHRDSLAKVAFFCTCGGDDPGRVFLQMTGEAGQPPLAVLLVRQSELASAPRAIAKFAAELAPAPPPVKTGTHVAPPVTV